MIEKNVEYETKIQDNPIDILKPFKIWMQEL